MGCHRRCFAGARRKICRQAFERGLKLFRFLKLRRVLVIGFLWIRSQIVELRPRSFYEFETFCTNRSQRRPAKTQGIIGFAESDAVSSLRLFPTSLQRLAIQIFGAGYFPKLQNGRQNASSADLTVTRCPRPYCSRTFDYQRHMCSRIVEKDAVCLLAMLSKSSSVVAHDHNNRIAIPAAQFEELDELPQCGICVRNLAIVKPDI